jgi:exonuclease III
MPGQSSSTAGSRRAQDFVIAHELLHLRVPSHGRLFKSPMTAHVPKWCVYDVARRHMTGDYNVVPTDLDIYAPEHWRDDALFRPEVRKACAESVKLGWKDALRHLYTGKRIYTFWKYFPNAFARGARLRIDHLLLSPSLKNRLVAGGVAHEVRSWERTSEHAPAWIELEDIAPNRFRKKARDRWRGN